MRLAVCCLISHFILCGSAALFGTCSACICQDHQKATTLLCLAKLVIKTVTNCYMSCGMPHSETKPLSCTCRCCSSWMEKARLGLAQSCEGCPIAQSWLLARQTHIWLKPLTMLMSLSSAMAVLPLREIIPS